MSETDIDTMVFGPQVGPTDERSNNYVAVHRWVYRLAAKVFHDLASIANGEKKPDDALNECLQHVDAVVEKVNGTDGITPGGTHSTSVGEFIVKTTGMNCPPSEAVRALLLSYVDMISNAITSNPDGLLFKAAFEGWTSEVIWLILGVDPKVFKRQEAANDMASKLLIAAAAKESS